MKRELTLDGFPLNCRGVDHIIIHDVPSLPLIDVKEEEVYFGSNIPRPPVPGEEIFNKVSET